MNGSSKLFGTLILLVLQYHANFVSNLYPAQSSGSKKNLLFILKGSFRLAHSQVLKNFFNGLTPEQASTTKITLLLLDDLPVSIPNVECISFKHHPLASDKLNNYILLTAKRFFSNVTVAVHSKHHSLSWSEPISCHDILDHEKAFHCFPRLRLQLI